MKNKKISIKSLITGVAFAIWLICFALACAVMCENGHGYGSGHWAGDVNAGYAFGIIWILLFFIAVIYFGALFAKKENLSSKKHLHVLSSLLGLSAFSLLISWCCYANAMDIGIVINSGNVVAYAVFGFFGMFAIFAMFHPWFNVGLPKICTKKQKKAAEQQPSQNN